MFKKRKILKPKKVAAIVAGDNFVSPDRCVMCGEVVPEGRCVCASCEKNGGPNQNKKGGSN